MPSRSASAYSRRAPLVARGEDLGRLLEAWTTCREQKRGTIAIIEGDSGTGKTRLLEELLERARLDRASVAAVRAVQADSTEPFATLIGLARGGMLDMPGLSSATPQSLGVLAGRIPEWADRYSPSEAAGLTVGRAFIEVFAAISQEQPVLLAVDDVQSSDRESILALGAVLRDGRAAPSSWCSLLPCRRRGRRSMTFASDPERCSRNGRAGGTVEGRGHSRTGSLGASRVHRDGAGSGRTAVAMDSAGLPLLVVELLHAVALGLDLRQSDGAWPSPLRTLSDTLPGIFPMQSWRPYELDFGS